MEQVTTRVPDSIVTEVEERADEHNVSKSEVIRTLLERGIEHEELQQENKRLRNQLQAVNSRQNDVEEIVEYIESEKSLREREAKRREMRASAGIVTKAKWTLFGMPIE